MSAVLVAQAVLADLDELTTLFDQYRQFQGQAPDVAACQAFLHERFNHGESVVFIARIAGRSAGFAQLYPSFSSTALARVYILNDLFVAPDARRGGVASALLAAVEGYARSFGACRVSLNVARDNPTAQALYEERGWTRDEVFFTYHRFPPAS